MKYTFQALTAVALATSLTAAMAAEPIKIGVAGPFTGGSSSMGVSMRDGVRLATDEINKAGGVLGRQILLVERDDEAKNERGVQIAQELINKEKVTATVAAMGIFSWVIKCTAFFNRIVLIKSPIDCPVKVLILLYNFVLLIPICEQI